MKILLCCNAGMSSSILVKNIKKIAEKREVDIVIKAVGSSAIKDEIGLWDICLVGPQLVYAVEEIEEQLKIPTRSIAPAIYAIADGDKALDFALSLLK